jgi:hypothetical protein
LVGVVAQKYIFWLQIGVNQVQIMQDCTLSAFSVLEWMMEYSQATLVKSCLAKL